MAILLPFGKFQGVQSRCVILLKGVTATIATFKASRVPKRFLQHCNLKPLIAAQDMMLTWFEVMGYTVLLESDIVCGYNAERSNNAEVCLLNRVHNALSRINSSIPEFAIKEAISQLIYNESLSLVENNHRFYRLFVDGMEVEYQVHNQIFSDKVWLIDFVNLLNNDWLVIHPFTVIENNCTYTMDAVVFINGLPLAVIISTQPKNEKATFKETKERLQEYFRQIPSLFAYNALLVIRSGDSARVGTLNSELKDFLPWHTIDGEDFPLDGETELEVLIQGIFDKRRFLELVRHFIVFENNENNIIKKFLRRTFCTIPGRRISGAKG